MIPDKIIDILFVIGIALSSSLTALLVYIALEPDTIHLRYPIIAALPPTLLTIYLIKRKNRLQSESE
jgi:hypothetical protein